MHLLVVEGNTREIWKEREANGGFTYHKRFQSMLKILQPTATIEIAFPADRDSFLPSIEHLRKFDGILWTGSSLFVNDPSPSVQRQLTFVKDIFTSAVPLYGSCWGMQLAAVVAGGKVDKCPNGREFGITNPIHLTKSGKTHPYFQGRKNDFQALTVHLEEVITVPDDAVVLATNDHSNVQAFTLDSKKYSFFGVQYHPEFSVADMAYISRKISKTLVEEKLFNSAEEVDNYALKLENKTSLPESVTNYMLHIQEVKLWLDSI
jgi:GMP synthase (glutamine-hydrolysing)